MPAELSYQITWRLCSDPFPWWCQTRRWLQKLFYLLKDSITQRQVPNFFVHRHVMSFRCAYRGCMETSNHYPLGESLWVDNKHEVGNPYLLDNDLFNWLCYQTFLTKEGFIKRNGYKTRGKRQPKGRFIRSFPCSFHSRHIFSFIGSFV